MEKAKYNSVTSTSRTNLLNNISSDVHRVNDNKAKSSALLTGTRSGLKLVNLNLNLTRIILNFLSIDEIILLLKARSSRLNKVFLELSFIKIYKIIIAYVTNPNNISSLEAFICIFYVLLRKENFENKNNIENILNNIIFPQQPLIAEKISEEISELTATQISLYFSYIFSLLCKQIKEINLQNLYVTDEDLKAVFQALKYNSSVHKISFSSENLNIKLCEELFEHLFYYNYTLTNIPYFVYKNKHIINEFHTSLNELFYELKGLDHKVRVLLKNYFTLNKKVFIRKDEFLKFIFSQYPSQYPETSLLTSNQANENEMLRIKGFISGNKYSDGNISKNSTANNNNNNLNINSCNIYYIPENKNLFHIIEKNYLAIEDIFNNCEFQINEFQLYKLIKAFSIVFNRHYFLGVYFYLSPIEILENYNSNNCNIKSQADSNSVSKVNNNTIKPQMKSNEKKKKKSLEFNITLINLESNLKLNSHMLSILLEISRLDFISLKYLDLKEIKLTDILFKELIIKMTAHELTHFIANSNFLSLENLSDLDSKQIKPRLSKLEVLNFDFNKISDKGFSNLITKFPLNKLKELSMNVNQITLQSLGNSVKAVDFDCLKTLHFHDNKINDAGFLNLLTKFKMPLITEINLSKNEITGENIYKIPEITFERLQYLYLDNNSIFDDGFTNILKKLKMPKIKILMLNDNQITAEYLIEDFCPAEAGRNASLQFKFLNMLNLKNNKISDLGLFNILTVFELPKILELNFNENFISGEILSSFAPEDLKKLIFPELKYLHLAGNKIGDKGFYSILASLQFPKIKKLQFNKNSITAKDPELIPKLSLNSLEYFFLAENNIEALDMAKITKKISMPEIRVFTINKDDVDDIKNLKEYDVEYDEN